MRLTFTIPGPPVPKARARVVTDKQGKTRGVTPKRTGDYERLVSLLALSARNQNYLWPEKDKSKRFGLLVKVHYSGNEGDGDNYVKSIADACNGVLWVDDRQIDDGRWIKAKVERGKDRVEVEAWVIEVDSRANTR